MNEDMLEALRKSGLLESGNESEEYIDPSRATAPYNFVSMAGDILPSELDRNVDWGNISEKKRIQEYENYIREKGKFSGYIHLELKTRTPCFIGGEGADFFSVNKEPLIPGSSLRGMVKNLLKIITWGSVGEEDIEDRHLYFRCLMAPKSMPQLKELNRYYKERMTVKNKDGDEIKKTKPGFLIRGKSGYYICPAEMKSVKKTDYGAEFPAESKVEWDDTHKGAYCLTGNRGKEYVRFLYQGDWKNRISVPERVIEEYRADKNRGAKAVDLLSDKGTNVKRDGQAYAFTGDKEIDRVVPCFFVREDDEITAFGHGRSFRIPYRNAVLDAVNPNLKGKTIDFSDAMFGKKSLWASRLFFDDARVDGRYTYLPANYVKPLMKPNPTSFQLYLKQGNDTYPPVHWDVEHVRVRGYKLYWHNDVAENEWQARGIEANDKITKKVKPLAAGTIFQADIRFEKLSDIELGALLKVLSLKQEGKEIVYKIGQGKSIGFGSISIQPKLYLTREDYYDQLFADGQWNHETEFSDPELFIRRFNQYIKKNLKKREKMYKKMMNELYAMMDWNNTQKKNWQQKIKMMSGDVQTGTVDERYVKRAVLPTALEVIK